MARSTELRWFTQGNPTLGFESWFQGGSPEKTEREPLRTDHYLALQENEVTGFKLRDGRLELKVQVSASRAQRWGDVAGKMDIWEKWSAGGGEILDQQLRAEGRWIPIEKDRMVRRYAQTSTGYTLVDPGVMIEKGFKVELCRLRIQLDPTRPTEPWWTFCLEGFDDRKSLVEGATWYFAQRPCPIRLLVGTSRSYPAWLSWLAFPFRPIP